MTLTLFGISSLYTGIQRFMNAAAHLESAPSSGFNSRNQLHQHNTEAQPQSGSRASQHRALRVLRVSEQGEAPYTAGRMIISGRMADVCAELDRLVALEAQNKASLTH